MTVGRKSGGSVLHVLDHSWPVLSGYSVRSRDLVTGQYRLGQPIMVVTGPLQQLDDSSAAEVAVDGVSYYRTPVTGAIARAALHRRWPLLREWQVVRLLRNRVLQVIDTYGVNTICAHSPALCGLAALQAARRRGLPFIYEIRAFWEDAAVDQERTRTTSLRYRLTRGLETYVARHADAVSGIAQHILDDLGSRGIPAQKLFHVPNGVDAKRFTAVPRDEELAAELGLSDGPVFGFFGSLYRYEGISWLIRAVAELRSRGNRLSLLILGRGEEQAAIRAAVSSCNLTDCVRFIDHVPHDQIKRYYSVVDIMVFPRLSVRLTELVTPLKPLEAMSLKKAVLASSVGGHRELIGHEVTGLLFRPEDVSDFCRQAERLITSPALREQLGERGREMILHDKDWKVLARKYQSIYEFVASNRRNAVKLVPQSAVGS
jgi:PEP-CTERM/exosortase A-associated glycosyltransferase